MSIRRIPRRHLHVVFMGALVFSEKLTRSTAQHCNDWREALTPSICSRVVLHGVPAEAISSLGGFGLNSSQPTPSGPALQSNQGHVQCSISISCPLEMLAKSYVLLKVPHHTVSTRGVGVFLMNGGPLSRMAYGRPSVKRRFELVCKRRGQS